jgi:fatty acid desaturase
MKSAASRTSPAAKEGVTMNDPSVRQASFEICRKMIDSEKLRLLQIKSDAQGLWHYSAHSGIIVFFAYAARQTALVSPVVSWICFICQAVAMAFLFTGFHELTHETVFRSRLANILCGNWWGLLIFRPFEHYRCYHYNHHKFTGDPARDPELQNSFIDLKLDNFLSYFVYLSGVPFWIDRLTTLGRHTIFGTSWIQDLEWTYLTNKSAAIVVREARIYTAIYVALLVVGLWSSELGGLLWQLWLLPTLFAQPFLRFYLLAEHTGCPQGDNMLSNTRTTETYRWYRWIAWFMPYHAEHHAFPFVPFHQLEALHIELVKNHENQRYRKCDPNGDSGYLGVHIRLWQKFMGWTEVRNFPEKEK